MAESCRSARSNGSFSPGPNDRDQPKAAIDRKLSRVAEITMVCAQPILRTAMIREYTDADCKAVIEVWSAASSVATPFLSEDFLAKERERIRTTWLSKASTWVFEDNGKLLGFLSLIGNEVGAIFVHPHHQGNGIGRALMDHAASLHNDLFLDVFEDNAIGRRFYDHYGFEFEYKHVHKESGHMQIRLSYSPNERPSS